MDIRILILSTFSFISKIIGRRAKHIGVSSGQPKVLDYLNDGRDGASQADIARACGLEASTLTQILDGMEKAGYIERKREGNDRRTYHIFLTVLGKEKAEQTVALFKNIENEILVGLSDQEKVDFQRMLQIVHDNSKSMYLDGPTIDYK